MTPDLTTRRNAYAAWIVVCVVWGTTYFGIRVALDTIPPALVGGIRYTIAGLLLIAILRVRGERLPGRETWPGLALLGFLLLAVGNGMVVLAEQWVPSGIAALVVASVPFWMSGVEALLPGGERLRTQTVAGLTVGFSGILLLVWPALTGDAGWGPRFALGIAALQLACIGWALGSAYGKRHAQQENALGASAFEMLFGGLIMLAVGTVTGEWSRLTFTARSVAAELYLTIVGSIVGYSAYVYALKYLPVSTVSLYAYVNPVIAVMLGTLLLDEPFTPRVLGAGCLVIAGIAIVRMQGMRVSARAPGDGARRTA